MAGMEYHSDASGFDQREDLLRAQRNSAGRSGTATNTATHGATQNGGLFTSPVRLNHDYRLEALRLASEASPGFAPADVTKRAQAYYDFLTGKEA